jgi:hypothetical protein
MQIIERAWNVDDFYDSALPSPNLHATSLLRLIKARNLNDRLLKIVKPPGQGRPPSDIPAIILRTRFHKNKITTVAWIKFLQHFHCKFQNRSYFRQKVNQKKIN